MSFSDTLKTRLNRLNVPLKHGSILKAKNGVKNAPHPGYYFPPLKRRF